LYKRIFPLRTDAEFEHLDIKNFNFIKNQDIEIKGLFSDLHHIYLGLEVLFCDKNSESCKPNLMREKFINEDPGDIIFITLFQNFFFKTSDYENPVVNYLEIKTTFLDFDAINYTSIFLSQKELVTDKGLVFQNEGDPETIISFENTEADSISKNYDENTIIYVEFYCSNIKYIYKRSYTKLTEILAEIIGSYEYLKILLKLFFYASSMKKNIRLMNTLFEFDNQKKEEKNFIRRFSNDRLNNNPNNKHDIQAKFSLDKLRGDSDEIGKDPTNNLNRKIYSKSKLKKNWEIAKIESRVKDLNANIDISKLNSYVKNSQDPSANPRSFLNASPNNTKLIHKNTENCVGNQNDLKCGNYKEEVGPNIDYFNVRKKLEKVKNLRLSNWEILQLNFFKFCLKNKKLKHKHKLYKLGLVKLDETMEIFYVLKKLEEVEKLKNILFNEQQLAIFYLSPLDIITTDKENIKKNELSKLKEFQKDHQKLNKEINKFKMKDKRDYLDLIDKRLINNLHDEIKNLIYN